MNIEKNERNKDMKQTWEKTKKMKGDCACGLRGLSAHWIDLRQKPKDLQAWNSCKSVTEASKMKGIFLRGICRHVETLKGHGVQDESRFPPAGLGGTWHLEVAQALSKSLPSEATVSSLLWRKEAIRPTTWKPRWEIFKKRRENLKKIWNENVKDFSARQQYQ